MTIEEIIQEALGAFGGSQQDLSVALGVSHSTVSRWLSGHGAPSEGSCLRLARITGQSARKVFAAAGHDADLLPPEPAGPSTEEADEVRRRVIARLERERLLREMPEAVRDRAERAMADVARQFHELGKTGDDTVPLGAL